MSKKPTQPKWTACQKTAELDPELQSHFAEQADILVDDLGRLSLKVILVPANQPWRKSYWGTGQRIRHVEQHNPDWYRRLYHEQGNIRRDRLLRSLGRITTATDRSHHSTNRETSHDCIARSLVLSRLVTGWEPEPVGDSPETYSPADCVRTELIGIDPINPVGACQTFGTSYEILRTEDLPLVSKYTCGV